MLRVADDWFADTDTGRQRRANEDAFYARTPVFALADGMGGAQAGEVASQTAIEVLQRGLGGAEPPGALLERLVQEANARVHALAASDEALAGMGTTMTVAHVGERDVTVAHVGDSRMYLLRGGELRRVTHDHSLVDEYLRQGRLTEEEAARHPQRSIITRAIGPEPQVEVDVEAFAGRAGDLWLICSDGLTDMVEERDVAAVLRAAGSPREAGRELIARANAAGGRDNITVLVFRLEDVAGPDEGTTREHEQATTEAPAVGGEQPTAVHGAAVAVAPAAVQPRAPRPPAAPPEPPARRRRFPVGLVLALVIGFTVLVSAYFASQTVYFVGASDDGYVAVFRGMPYELPAGLDLWTEVYVSGVPASQARTTVGEHELRSRDDAYALVRALERGEVLPS